MFTEHVGNLQAAQSLDDLKQVLEQILGDCESALTHEGSLTINGALPSGATDAVLHIKNGYIAPNDGTTAPDANGELPNGWAGIFDGGVWFKGQVKFDQGVGGGITLDDILGLFPAGFKMNWPDTSTIPTGWALMDGVANASGSGINMGGRVPQGYISGDPTFGTIDATVSPALTWSGSPITASDTTSLTIAQAVTGISISAHAGSGTDFNTAAEDPTGTITPSPVIEERSDAGGVTYYVWPTTDASPSVNVASHVHSVNDTDVAAALANHTITEPNSGAGHSHTGTVSNSSIASALEINTPATVRPAGIVWLWVEKLP